MNRELLSKALCEIDESFIADAYRRVPEAAAGSSERIVHMRKKRIVTFALAAALILALGVTAYAIGVHTGFLTSVFGTGLKGREAFDVEIKDDKGNTVTTEHYPAIERVDVDEELAENLTGNYIAAVGQSVELDGFTFTIQEALLDDNGIGALTVHVSNPDGHELKQSGHYENGERPRFGWTVYSQGDEMHMMDMRDYILPDSFSDTDADFVLYITPFTPLPSDAGLTLKIMAYKDGMNPPDWPTAELTIPAQEKVPARELTGDGITAKISPVGLTLCYDIPSAQEVIDDSMELIFSDGSIYTIKGDDLVNFALASCSPDQRTLYYCFNRLCDTEAVTELRLQSHWYAAGEQGNHTIDTVLR